MQLTTVYALKCKTTRDVYVGSTINYASRIRYHRSPQTSLQRTQKLKKKSRTCGHDWFIAVPLFHGPDEEARQLECDLIKKFKPSLNFTIADYPLAGHRARKPRYT